MIDRESDDRGGRRRVPCVREVLANRDHRPGWEAPRWPPVLSMVWDELCFLHWPVDAGAIQEKLPRGLVVDEHEGRAYVGIVPFSMPHIGPRGLPAMGALTSFLELNVRTYVRPESGGPPGVYFFSLDANHGLGVELARLGFGLRYFHARISKEGWRFESVRRDWRLASARFLCEYRAAPRGEKDGAFEPDGLDRFLTERYCLYAQHPLLGLMRGDIHHGPWVLEPAELGHLCSDLLERHGFAPGIEASARPIARVAKRIEVVAWAPTRV